MTWGDIRSGRRFDAAPIVRIELDGDPDKPISTGKRQRAQQHCMDEAEDGCVGADAEAERPTLVLVLKDTEVRR